MAAHQSAVLRRDGAGQETLLNLLLRSYLADAVYDQAEKFRAQAQKGDGTWRLPAQYARYLFHLGVLRAVGLEYSEARDALAQAARKAPAGAVGFLAAANKWLIVVRLLLGEVPERSEFAAPGMRAPLALYFELTTAVRAGDLAAFECVCLVVLFGFVCVVVCLFGWLVEGFPE
jgi:26S proteasome regulatory subunit N3